MVGDGEDGGMEVERCLELLPVQTPGESPIPPQKGSQSHLRHTTRVVRILFLPLIHWLEFKDRPVACTFSRSV